MDNEEQRRREAQPLIQLAAKGIGEALALRHVPEDDPRWHGRILQVSTHLHFALKCLYGVQGLFANLASSHLDKVDMAIHSIEPVGDLAHRFMHAYDDEVLLDAFWVIADQLLSPQIGRLMEVLDEENST